MNAAGAIIVMSTFAAIWWMVGAAQLGRGSVMMYAAGIVISGLMVALGWRRGGPPAAPEERKRRGRMVGIASTVEGVAILVAVNVLVKLGRRDLIAPAVAIIVGLHFLPLARWFPAPIYYLTGALLIAAGMAGTLVQDLPARILTVCLGAAAVLWFSCGVVLFRAHQRRNESAGEKA
ncbi:MAG TPA: hypothetical protein VMB85_00365 [Bryobacteraceae bacterium]|nr:hypothetical protein [Bryobacteraceae bacterium]